MMFSGILKAWDGANFLADVAIQGALVDYWTDVRTSVAIASADMTVGRRVLVWADTPSNPETAVVIAVWDS